MHPQTLQGVEVGRAGNSRKLSGSIGIRSLHSLLVSKTCDRVKHGFMTRLTFSISTLKLPQLTELRSGRAEFSRAEAAVRGRVTKNNVIQFIHHASNPIARRVIPRPKAKRNISISGSNG